MAKLIAALIVVVACLSSSIPANAGLGFCNQTSQPLWITVGWNMQNSWVARGWYKIEAGDCNPLFDGPLQARYYYYYTKNENGKLVWSGDSDSTGALFCTEEFSAFYYTSTPNCTGLKFKQVDTGQDVNYTVTFAESSDPRQAALDCRNEMTRGRDAFARCWMRRVSTERQRRILDCWDRAKTNAGFAICANKDNMSADAYKVANCVDVYTRNNSGSDLAMCLAKGNLSSDNERLLECALRNQDSVGAMGTCAIGQQLSPDERRIINCVATNRGSYVNMGICAAGTQISPEQQRIAGCVLNNRGSYLQMGVCAAGPQLTPEQQVFATCAIQTGGQPYAFAGCVGTQLTANELQKCIDQGVGGSGCFGDNNFVVNFYRNYWHDVTQGPGRGNELFGADGFLGRTLEDIRNNAPPPLELGEVGGFRVCIPWC
jgi:uncharacterized membrane protein